MDETGSQEDAALSLSDGGPLIGESGIRAAWNQRALPSEVEAS